MTDDRDIEQVIRVSLDDRAARLPATRGRLMSVLDRVERRRNRRRRGVAVGSVAVVGLGVVGLMTTGGTEPDLAAGDGEGTLVPVEPTASAPPATVDLGDELWWACTDELERDDGVTYYASCEQLPADARLLTTDELRDLTGAAPTTSIAPIATTVPVTQPPDDAEVTISEEEQRYTIVVGDSLSRIAARFGIDVDVLVAYNEWQDGISHVILPGDIVRIPPGATTPQPAPVAGEGGRVEASICLYTIVAGDNPTNVAERFGISIEALEAMNPPSVMSDFLVGAQLIVPANALCG